MGRIAEKLKCSVAMDCSEIDLRKAAAIFEVPGSSIPLNFGKYLEKLSNILINNNVR